MWNNLKSYLTQWSTWRGLLLIGASVAGLHPVATEAVLSIGDMAITGQSAGIAVAGVFGSYETLRNERKPWDYLRENEQAAQVPNYKPFKWGPFK
ncbi:hypothetical protein [Shewanella violacea]|uniref:Holin n=1 Tax=Shewanella violacea (strain JCM 10179 / CIP 106290 / LMG 19151 / DSS12) TaxID=637905 RepID=D4ZKF2_SHEVD|nr:hypothetical protein [Shewanella violacea]BAJ02151.1 hypothetical protein SVI_2180 [Shewanella violacea DSS12]